MPPVGVEPTESPIYNNTVGGPKASNAGQETPKAGHPQGLTNVAPCKGRTGAGHGDTKPGTPVNTTKAQQEHNRSITAPGLPADLPPAVLAGLRDWHKLPGHIRTAVEALLEGAAE